MEITPEKITEILSDPQKLALISSLVNGMSANQPKEEFTTSTHQEENLIAKQGENQISPQDENAVVQAKNAVDNDPQPTPPETVNAISNIAPLLSNSIAGKGIYDERINLLKAVRPFLGEGRKEKVDSLIKALGAARIIGTIKGTDILNFLK